LKNEALLDILLIEIFWSIFEAGLLLVLRKMGMTNPLMVICGESLNSPRFQMRLMRCSFTRTVDQ
jgi:hypothetical protein